MPKWIDFVYSGQSKSGKTEVWDVMSKRHGFRLGTITWSGRWRCYVLNPDAKMMFDKTCMNDVIDKLDELNKKVRK